MYFILFVENRIFSSARFTKFSSSYHQILLFTLISSLLIHVHDCHLFLPFSNMSAVLELTLFV